MTDIRYMGTSTWDRIVLDDKGKREKVERVSPGDKISVSEDEAKILAGRGPRHLRNFVYVGSKEDPQSNNYEPSRYEAVSGNATPYPELDMGSTVVSGRTITRTEDDNEEGFPVARSDEGPASDNEELILKDEAQAAANKALEDAKAKQASRGRPSGGQGGAAETRKS